MEMTTTITPKFQVHIPVAIRRKIGLKNHGKVRIRVEESKIIIEPVRSTFLSLAGKYRVAKPIKAEKIRDFIDYSEKI